jgi:hypothetical protein
MRLSALRTHTAFPAMSQECFFATEAGQVVCAARVTGRYEQRPGPQRQRGSRDAEEAAKGRDGYDSSGCTLRVELKRGGPRGWPPRARPLCWLRPARLCLFGLHLQRICSA